MTGELTGRHVLLIAVSAFAIIIAANLTMLFAATGSFPGLVVSNPYVASQNWNGRADRQKALGWSATVTYAQNRLTVRLVNADGAPVDAAGLSVKVGRPTTDVEDRQIALIGEADLYKAPLALAPGRWQVEITAQTRPDFRQRVEILAPETP